jgi:hypothetical protein
VSSDPPSLVCTGTCTSDWDPGSQVTLVARAAAGRRLVRWSGACRGDGSCELTLDRASSVTAVFGPARFALSVGVTGRGVVRSTPSGLVCPTRCTARFTSFQPVRLRAVPATGWRFSRWSGSCRGRRTTCTVPLRAATSARAVFVRR